jgi:arsenate reductase-like glutaredoxin family protein
MKQNGSTTVIGLLAFLLLTTFGAAAYFVSRAYAAQNNQAIAVRLIGKQKQKTIELEQIVKRLELEWKVAATESDNAMAQLDQLQGLINDQNQEIDYLLDNLQSVSNQLAAAVAVEANLNQRLVQLDKEKNDAVEVAAGLADQLKALEKEFEASKVSTPRVVATNSSPPTVAGLPLREVELRLKELEEIKKTKEAVSILPNTQDNAPSAISLVTGTVRKVDTKFGFVVLDLGAPDGVRPGDFFSVTRAGEPVGQVCVRKMLSGLPICDIIADKTVTAILQGDQVRQLK